MRKILYIFMLLLMVFLVFAQTQSSREQALQERINAKNFNYNENLLTIEYLDTSHCFIDKKDKEFCEIHFIIHYNSKFHSPEVFTLEKGFTRQEAITKIKNYAKRKVTYYYRNSAAVYEGGI